MQWKCLTLGERRVVRRFAWLPTLSNDQTKTIWFERYDSIEEVQSVTDSWMESYLDWVRVFK